MRLSIPTNEHAEGRLKPLGANLSERLNTKTTTTKERLSRDHYRET
jgi:hypothetical protein